MMLRLPDKVRMDAGLINIMQEGIGGTVGLATMSPVLERYTAYHMRRRAQRQGAS